MIRTFEALKASMSDGPIFHSTHSLPAVYLIKHRLSGKLYVGSTRSLYHRESEHRCSLERGEHENESLQAAYDRDNRVWLYYLLVADIELALDYEQMVLDFFKGTGVLFNTAYDARKPSAGRPFTEEARRKMSEALKGRIFSAETIRRMSDAKKGRTYSDEHKQAIKDAHALRQHQSSTPVVINGENYKSVRHASIELGISRTCVVGRIQSNADRFVNWLYAKADKS